VKMWIHKGTLKMPLYILYTTNIRNFFAFSKFFFKKNENILKMLENTIVFAKKSCIFVCSLSPSPLSASETTIGGYPKLQYHWRG
jgi:hypothetical protein